jgi:hypothetical protein
VNPQSNFAIDADGHTNLHGAPRFFSLASD